jgi:lipopolysaccharide transport system permease protein
MWAYRELIKNLTMAEFKNRYQNTVLGFFWSILSPLLFATVLFVVFRNVFGQEKNFAINLLVGITAWRFFTGGTTSSLNAVVSKSSLVTKVYIPRQILVLSSVLAMLMTSTLEFIVLLPIIFVLTGGIPATVPLFLLVSVIYFWIIFGIGLFLGSLFVYFRDINQIWDIVLQSLFFACPIVYPLSVVPQSGVGCQ